MDTLHKPLFSLHNIKKTFATPEGKELTVLDNINFTMYENEVVALLGKSGSGKSTLLRIIAGLTKPSQGYVVYKGQHVTQPVQGISMVFQSFALMPWLTVLQNVELGLEVLGIDRHERRKRALKAIDSIGLDGFESAYPKELSGGMRQRVGFARALVVNPELLLMDEPFSALDILTTESLRGDLIDLWRSGSTRTKGILIVTHDIEEAALMADRIVIFSSNPGRIKAILRVDPKIERSPNNPAFHQLIDEIYTLMTTDIHKGTFLAHQHLEIDMHYRLPDAEPSKITALVDAIHSLSHLEQAAQQGIDLPALSEAVQMDVDDLFPLTEALEILGFARVLRGDIQLTEEGGHFQKADMLERKQIFARMLFKRVPLAKHIRHTLDAKGNHMESEEVFLRTLEYALSEDESERVLKTMIDWGRYAEIFAYDYSTGMLSLENPE